MTNDLLPQQLVAVGLSDMDSNILPTETNTERDAREMLGYPFQAYRAFKGAAVLQGRERNFADGLEVALRWSNLTLSDVARDRGYDTGWVTDIKRRLKAGSALTKETVVYLRESLPLLHRWMTEGRVLWPKMPEFVDYAVTRAGVQTERRKVAQRRARLPR